MIQLIRSTLCSQDLYLVLVRHSCTVRGNRVVLCCDRCCVLSTDTEQTSAVSVCLSDSHITHSLCVAFLFACLVPRLGLLSVASQLARSTGPLSVRVAVFLLHWIATVGQTLELSKITSECGCDPLSCFQLPTSLHRLSSICIRKSSEISPCGVRTYDATFQGVCQNRLKTVPKRYRVHSLDRCSTACARSSTDPLNVLIA